MEAGASNKRLSPDKIVSFMEIWSRERVIKSMIPCGQAIFSDFKSRC